MIELFVEGYQVDISQELSTKISYAIDDIKDFSAKNTNFSRTVILPGSNRNNVTFGHIFQTASQKAVNNALPNVNANFNPAKSAQCLIFQDRIQIFKGVLQLLEVIDHNGQIEYEVAVFGELTGFISAIGNRKLEDLDFTPFLVNYDTDYTLANITSSWLRPDAPTGDGIYFPLIDYGTYSTNKKDWDYRTFRPALFVKDYLDKIFYYSGYRYDCSLFETSRFKKQFVPHNQKTLTALSNLLGSLATTGTQVGSGQIQFNTVAGGFSADAAFKQFTYTGTGTASFKLMLNINLQVTGSAPDAEIRFIRYNAGGAVIEFQTLFGPGLVTGNMVTPADYFIGVLNPGEKISVNVLTGGASIQVLSASLTVTTDNAVQVPVTIGQSFAIKDIIPKGILQKDFFSSILKLWNLYVYEDRFDEKKLIIQPFIDFYNADPATYEDWTYKLDRSKPIRYKPMSEHNARYYIFKFKEDSDYYNDQYKKRYNETYGSRTLDTGYEFAKEKQEVDLIFAGTPLVGYNAEVKVYSTILKKSNNNEENVDSVIRILQAKRVTAVPSWKIRDNTTNTDLQTCLEYGYGGHLDDPDAPGNDNQFGVPKELFFTLVSGALHVNQFNVYWSPYMAEIVDKDSKLMTAYFYLTAKDIKDLDFSRFKYIDGSLWRLNKIVDYNATYPELTKVELLKVIELAY